MKQLIFGEVFYCCDNLAINIPSKIFLIEELRKGIFPLWNPYILSGSPFLADINLSLLYQLNLLYFIFTPFRALTIGVVIDFILAISGMYILCKSLKFSSFAATLSAIIFTFSGTLVTYINNVPMLQVASLLPWVMWAWIQFFNNPTKQFYLLLVGFLTLQISAGHPQLTYYTWLLGITYVFFVSRISVKQKFISFVTVFGLVFLLSAVQTIPFIELVRSSTRIGKGFSYASFDSLHPFNIVRLVIPNIVGNLSQGSDWLQGGSVYGYVGLFSLMLLLWIPFKNIRVRFFAVITIVSFFLALGKYTPMFFIAYKLIPGLGNFRSPQHFLLLYTFSIAILSGFGIDEALQKNKWKTFLNVLFVIALFFIVFGFVWIGLGRYVLMIIPKFRQFALPIQRDIIFLISKGCIISGILYLISYFVNRKAVFLLVIFLELFIFSSHSLVSVEEKKLAKWFESGRKIAERMRDSENGYRIFVSPQLYANPVKKQFGIRYMEKETAWQLSIMRTNINMLYNLSTIDGYASLIDRSYKESFQKGEGDPTGIDFGDMKNIAWDNFGVRYILASPNKMVFKNNPVLIPIWSDSNRILYKNPNAFPVAPVVYHPKSVIFGFWLSIVGLVFYGGLFMVAFINTLSSGTKGHNHK